MTCDSVKDDLYKPYKYTRLNIIIIIIIQCWLCFHGGKGNIKLYLSTDITRLIIIWDCS